MPRNVEKNKHSRFVDTKGDDKVLVKKTATKGIMSKERDSNEECDKAKKTGIGKSGVARRTSKSHRPKEW